MAEVFFKDHPDKDLGSVQPSSSRNETGFEYGQTSLIIARYRDSAGLDNPRSKQ